MEQAGMAQKWLHHGKVHLNQQRRQFRKAATPEFSARRAGSSTACKSQLVPLPHPAVNCSLYKTGEGSARVFQVFTFLDSVAFCLSP